MSSGRGGAKPSKADARRRRKAAKDAKRKQPATTVDVPLEKRPVPGPVIADERNAKIMFRLGLMDHDGRWSFANLTPAEVKLIASSCKNWESLTTAEFMNLPGHTPIPQENLIPAAQARLTELGLSHFEFLWHLRPRGEPRIWGLLDRHCFYLIWWDPQHEVCPVAKKNT